MTKIHDEKIIVLQKQIEKKKEELGKIKKFSPVTNCILQIKEATYNLNALNQEGLLLLLAKLINYQKALKETKYYSKFTISGYHIENWIDDIENKLEITTYKEQLTQLKKMESTLANLLSEDKKLEIEINEIANSLDNILK